jgi:DNA replication protein DnaC
MSVTVSFYFASLKENPLTGKKWTAKRIIKNAMFPVIKTIDTFDFTLGSSVNEKLIRELMISEYIDKKENILFAGSNGTGKSHLATALT